MSFTFTAAFPSYRFEFVDTLIADGTGKPIPLKGGRQLNRAGTNVPRHRAGCPDPAVPDRTVLEAKESHAKEAPR
jgi:hypothetical protein